MVWRGPRAKYQVTLSERPSMWHAPHEPHAAPASDQRPRPVLKKRLPLSADSAADPAIGSAEDAVTRKSDAIDPTETACVLRSTAVTSREPSFATNANARVLLMATPMGRRIVASVDVRTSMNLLVAEPTLVIIPLAITRRNSASAPSAAT